MEIPAKPARIARLRTLLAGLETRVPLGGTSDMPKPAGPVVLGAEPGVLHEVWADRRVEAGALLGFALMQAKGLLTGTRQAVFWLQRVKDAQETGLPYGAGLMRFGIGPEQLLIGRMADVSDLLWAIEEAVACPAVAAVVADIGQHHKALDFTASRRLSLRCSAAGASVFLMRYGQEREATAAGYRWHVAPAPSHGQAYDVRAPGAARWQVRLEKGQRLQDGASWILQGTGNGFTLDTGAGASGAGAAASGAYPALLGDRLPQTA